jgi:Na+/H+ antiporter NhaD/arsenite permease-like protein
VADFIWPIVSIGILALIILIGVLLLWKTRAMLKEKKSGFPLKDERTQKLNGKAAYYAMFICQYFILAFVWIIFIGKEFFGMPEIEAGYPMIATLLVSALSFLMLRWHFGKKGEP